MSIVRVLRGSTASRSSSVTTTLFPLSSSYECVIASYGTSFCSSEHQRCVSTGTLSFSWSWRKCRSRSCTALSSCTGTFTRPKLSEPVQIARGTTRSAPRTGHARLERGHQIAGLGRLAPLRERLDLALRLRLDVLEQPLSIGVLVARRVELRLQRLHELARHVELALRRLARRAPDVEVLRRHELVGEAHRVHGERFVERPDRHQVLAVVEDPAADADAIGFLQGVMEQPVSVLALVLAAEEVRPVVHHGVDVRRADEVLDLDQARRLARGGLQLLVLEHDVLAVRDL